MNLIVQDRIHLKMAPAKESCSDCFHAMYGVAKPRCMLYGLRLYSRNAIACNRWTEAK